MSSRTGKARIAGLVFIAASAVGALRLMYIPKILFVHADAAATADRIAAHELLFRLGIVGQLAAAALWIFVPLALYRLLEGVDHGLAVLMVILGSLMQVPIFFVNAINDTAALLWVRGADSLSVFDKTHRDALAMAFLDLHHEFDLANAVFWGLWLIPFGLLVYRSRFLPRFLGVWLMLECFAWLAFSVTGLLLPGRENRVLALGQPLMLAEVATMLWLAIRGASEPRPAPAAS